MRRSLSTPDNGNSATRSFGVELDDPTEVHDANQDWFIRLTATATNLLCGSGPSSVTVRLTQGGGVGEILETAISITGSEESYQLSQAEIDEINMSDIASLRIEVEVFVDSDCCSNCSTQFPTFSTNTFGASYLELDIV